MSKTIKTRKEARAWHELYDPLAPKEGDVAPDFELRDVNGENPVRLARTAVPGRPGWARGVRGWTGAVWVQACTAQAGDGCFPERDGKRVR